jgi:hypothetical protein
LISNANGERLSQREIDRAAFLPSLVDSTQGVLGIGRLESDLQADIGKVWRGVVHPEKSARVGLTISRGLNGV